MPPQTPSVPPLVPARSGKAPGNDSIPPEVLKQGKQTIPQPLHELLCLCWEQGHIPQDMTDANIVTLQQQPLFLDLVDLTKAFDLVSRSRLFKILQKIGCPPKLPAIITSFHQDMQSMVCFDEATSNAFPVSSGVKQGCVLASTLFGFFFSTLLQYASVDCTGGVYVWTRSDARLHAKTKAYVVLIQELLFAGDTALTSHSKEGLQHLVDKLSLACKEFGLTISLRKTE